MSYQKHYYDKKKPKARFHFGLIFVFAALSFGVCFALYMIGSQDIPGIDDVPYDSAAVTTAAPVTAPEETPADVAETTEAKPAVPKGNPISQRKQAPRSYLDSCVFIGDSLTVGLSSYGILPEKNVVAQIGLNIDKINTAAVPALNAGDPDMTVLEAVVSRAPENIYIMLGSNGISWLSNDFMIKEYSAFIDGLKGVLPDADYYILAVPPVAASRENHSSVPIQNSEIDAFNSELLKLANDKGIYFVDVNTALKGNDGKMPDDAVAKDGMHFNKSTYDKMLEYILCHVAGEEEEGVYTTAASEAVPAEE